MYNKERILDTVIKFAEAANFPRDTFIISMDAALVIGDRLRSCENLDVEVLPHNFIKLACIYPHLKTTTQSKPRRDGRIEFMSQLNIKTQKNSFTISDLLIPDIEVLSTDGVFYRTVPSVVNVKRYAGTPKDYRDIISLGYTP